MISPNLLFALLFCVGFYLSEYFVFKVLYTIIIVQKTLMFMNQTLNTHKKSNNKDDIKYILSKSNPTIEDEVNNNTNEDDNKSISSESTHTIENEVNNNIETHSYLSNHESNDVYNGYKTLISEICL